ncbi:Rieske (2Fe-2S) protein [Sphingomonas azotifigens]|uniref:Rieske (2Fe-2S) protein n=1 Tax=Sphingomonas azotifigens TaxID=330920 RepID=UPI000A01DB45|nr:Rieske (2Fe-2S) protein [Sphingomonas azotifigens]
MTLYAICPLSALPSRQPRSFVLLRRDAEGQPRPWPIVVIRWGKHLLGYENRCPHAGTNLDWERGQFLDSSGTRLQCGKHGALFDLASGACIDGPCVGAALTPVALVIDEDEVCVADVELVEAG